MASVVGDFFVEKMSFDSSSQKIEMTAFLMENSMEAIVLASLIESFKSELMLANRITMDGEIVDNPGDPFTDYEVQILQHLDGAIRYYSTLAQLEEWDRYLTTIHSVLEGILRTA